MKKVAVHQPNFLPWPGFFHKWMAADVFVLLDTVQFEKNEFQNRNRIKTAHGPTWLTVPVRHRFPMRIDEVPIAPGPWPKKHRRTIEQAYARAPALDEVWSQLAPLWDDPPELLRDFNLRLLRRLAALLGIEPPVVLASDLGVDDPDPSRRLAKIVRALDGEVYLAGAGGRNYMDLAPFREAGIEVRFQRVRPPEYPQLHGPFAPYLSVLDLLLNTGREAGSIVAAMGDFA